MANVADLEIGKTDGLGQKISCIYGRKAPSYGVYGAGRRVMICFADASEAGVAQQQRKDMSTLAPLRGEIDGLIDGWRQGTNRSLLGARQSSALRGKANRYNRRVADALIVALEGDLASAAKILAAIKQDILDERIARARFEYLIAAGLAGMALMFAAWLITSTYALGGDPDTRRRTFAVGVVILLMALLGVIAVFYARWASAAGEEERSFAEKHAGEAGGTAPDPVDAKGRERVGAALASAALLFGFVAIPIVALLLLSVFTRAPSRAFLPQYRDAVTLWRAAAAGSVGAFFSIAIGIRGRTVLPDLLRTSNLMDAALRVSIGFIGAGVFKALLLLGVVRLSLGGYELSSTSLVGVLVAGFIAGFSERLVPDLLARASAQPGAPPPASPSTSTAASGGSGAGPRVADAAAGSAGAAASTSAPADPDPDQAQEDGCLADHPIDDADITPDSALPPASGGVAPVSEEPKQ